MGADRFCSPKTALVMEINCENGLTSDRLEDGEGRSQDALYEDVVVVEMSMAAERLRKNSINSLVKRGKAGPTGSRWVCSRAWILKN